MTIRSKGRLLSKADVRAIVDLCVADMNAEPAGSRELALFDLAERDFKPITDPADLLMDEIFETELGCDLQEKYWDGQLEREDVISEYRERLEATRKARQAIPLDGRSRRRE